MRVPRPATTTERIVVLACCAAAGVVYVLLWWLDPDPRGFGTHEQLGMKPCSWAAVHGTPCPTCGVTTAAVLLLHLRPLAALATQPFGALLTLAGLLFAGLGVSHAWRGESLFARMAGWPWVWIVLAAAALLLGSWWWVSVRFA